MAKVADGFFVAQGPKAHGGASKRIPEAESSTKSITVGSSKFSEYILGGYLQSTTACHSGSHECQSSAKARARTVAENCMMIELFE